MKFSSVCVLTRSSNKPFLPALLYTLFIVIFLISGCSSHPKGPPGKGIMNKNSFVDLLVDIHFYEGVYSATEGITSYHPDMSHDTVDYYQGIFEKHGVTREEFQKSLNYYSYSPSQFERLYTRVIDELNIKMSEAEIKELDLLEPSKAAEPPSRGSGNLWNLSENWSFPGPDTNKMISFKIPAGGPGTYTFTANIRLDGLDISENPSVSLWFWYDDGTEYGYRENFIPFRLDKDGEARQVTVAKELTNPDVTHVKGRVLDLSNPEDIGERHARVRNIRLNFSESPDPELR
jgi:hypothetical protein